MNDDPGSRMHEITDVPIREKADNDDKIFEERNDEDLKVEEGYVDANAQEVPVNNESVQFGGSKVTTIGESFPNVIPASKLASEIKVQHEVDDVSEVLARERGNDEDKVKPEVENLKNELVPALANHVGQEESVELVTTIAIAEFETKKPIWSGTSVKPREDLVRYDAEGEDDVVDAKCDDATESYDEDYVKVYDDNLENVIKEEKHDYHETSGKESVNFFSIVRKEEKILVSQETSDGAIAKDNEGSRGF